MVGKTGVRSSSWFWVAALLVAAALVTAGWSRIRSALPGLSVFGESQSLGVAGGMPHVMHTGGGLLEVSTVTVYERFTQESVKSLLGMELPAAWFKTVSYLQLRTVYRYHIQVARQWPLERHGDLWIVRAPQVQPTLPVAFDTRDLEHHTEQGWVRSNKLQNVVDLFRKLSPTLEERSRAPANLQLARDAGRTTIARFVRTWMLASKAMAEPQKARVVVLFPGEELGQE